MSQVSTSYASAKGCSRCSLETAGYERRDSITGCGEERAAKDYKYILKEWVALRVRSDLLLKLWIFLCYSPPSNSRGIGARKFRNCCRNGSSFCVILSEYFSIY